MQDFEKNRSEYVAQLEEQIRGLQQQLAEHKPLSEKWTPRVSSEISVLDGAARVTLSFGGKSVTATVTVAALNSNSETDLTTSITDTLCESLLVEKIRVIVRPEVERLMRNAQQLPGVGKW